MIRWHDNKWIHVGAVVRLTDRPDGEVISSHPVPGGARTNPETWPSLRGGARGCVVQSPSGGSPASDCPDHYLGIDDCFCARDSGVIPEKLPSAVVEWELDDGETKLRRLLRYPGTEGHRWELVDED